MWRLVQWADDDAVVERCMRLNDEDPPGESARAAHAHADAHTHTASEQVSR